MMRIGRHLRFSLLAVMTIIALAAGLFGWVAAERQKKIATLTAAFQSSESRAAWAERMNRLCYVSKAELKKAQSDQKRLQGKLSRLGVAPTNP
jgi:uncharacterized protein HemX